MPEGPYVLAKASAAARAFRDPRLLRISTPLRFGSMFRRSPSGRLPAQPRCRTRRQRRRGGGLSASREPSSGSAGTILPAPRLPSRISRACQLFTSGVVRSAKSDGIQFGAHPVLRRLHQRAMEWRADGKRDGPFCARRFRQIHRTLDRAGMPRNDDLVGRVEIGCRSRLHLAPLRPGCRPVCPREVSARAAIAPTPAGTADCMNCPRFRTSRRASAKRTESAATSAEYSLRLCPAT